MQASYVFKSRRRQVIKYKVAYSEIVIEVFAVYIIRITNMLHRAVNAALRNSLLSLSDSDPCLFPH